MKEHGGCRIILFQANNRNSQNTKTTGTSNTRRTNSTNITHKHRHTIQKAADTEETHIHLHLHWLDVDVVEGTLHNGDFVLRLAVTNSIFCVTTASFERSHCCHVKTIHADKYSLSVRSRCKFRKCLRILRDRIPGGLPYGLVSQLHLHSRDD